MCSGAAPSVAGSSFRNESAQIGITFSPKAIADGLRAIYYKEIDVHTEIETQIFNETLRLFNLAAAKGFAESTDPAVLTDRFLYEIRTNNAVFSAFRTHRMQNDIAAQLIDPDTGLLKSFDQWKRDIRGITDHYCVQWLQTEYDTAIIRAHQAADWKHFIDEQDVFPNVRWMPTTSVTPDPLHERFWSKRLTLPVNHPFWQDHRPGDRWNCKCSLQQTDEPVNAEALEGYTPPLPMPGLDNNPANDGKLFSDTHPYFTEAYPGAQQAAAEIVKKRSPSSMRRTEAEKAEILRRWAERKIIRANERMISESLGIPVPKEPMTFASADNGATNPNYESAQSFRVNCQCCVVSHELRMRGWDVEAVPNLKTGIPHALSLKTQLAWVDRSTNAAPIVNTVTSNTSEGVIKKLVDTIKTPGRYHISWRWRGKRSGHIITYELKDDGTQVFYDPQAPTDKAWAKPMTSDEFYRAYGYKIMPYGSYAGISYYRVDNLNLSKDYGVKAIKKK